jgi:uncharacterized damage-inducible protein DinB
MNPTRLYDYLALARAKVFDLIRPLGEGQYSREFPFGFKSLKATLPHMLNAEWAYANRMSRAALPQNVSEMNFPVDPKVHPSFPELERAWLAQSERTRAAIAGVKDWAAPLEYLVNWDGPTMRIRTTPGDVMSQLVIHEAHHRAQCMAMLRQLGVTAEDLDYSYWMYQREQV